MHIYNLKLTVKNFYMGIRYDHKNKIFYVFVNIKYLSFLSDFCKKIICSEKYEKIRTQQSLTRRYKIVLDKIITIRYSNFKKKEYDNMLINIKKYEMIQVFNVVDIYIKNGVIKFSDRKRKKNELFIK